MNVYLPRKSALKIYVYFFVCVCVRWMRLQKIITNEFRDKPDEHFMTAASVLIDSDS